MTQDEHNKAALLAAKFVLTKLGVGTNSPLWNWIEQEVQAWISGGYEHLLRESIVYPFTPPTPGMLKVLREQTKFTEVGKGIRRRRAMLKAMTHGPGIVKIHWDNPIGGTLEKVKRIRPKPSGKATREKARHGKKVAASRSARRKATRRR